MESRVPAAFAVSRNRTRGKHSAFHRFGGCRHRNAPWPKKPYESPRFCWALTKRHSGPTPTRPPAPADCQRQWRFRDRAEHDAEPVLPDAADDEEDGEVPEDDGPDGRRGGGVDAAALNPDLPTGVPAAG